MHDLLGAIKRRLRRGSGKRILDRAKRLAALKKRLAARKLKKIRTTRPLVKKPFAKALLSRLPVATKKELIKRAILKKPALKKKLVLAMLKKKLQERQAGAFMPSTFRQTTPVPAVSPTPPTVPDPAAAPIPQEEGLTPGQAVEEEMQERPLAEAAEEEAEQEEGAEEAQQEATEDTAEEVDELSEPDSEELAEQAEEAANDEAAATEASGDNAILGAFFGSRLQQLRRRNRSNMCLRRCAPLARQIESVTGGALPAKQTLKAVKVVAKAKAGDKRTKRGIKTLVKKAKKGNKPAKKAVAALHVANKIIKKTKPKTKKAGKKTVRKVPYTKPVQVVNKGLYAYSAHQRGLAMIPGFARARYGS
jgi:hypothetical protein